jgi:hypothetical protein
MWTTIALVAAASLGAAQPDKLALTNVRTTFGLLGAPRADAKFLPGDHLYLSFDVTGLQVDDSGKVLYSIAMEVTNSKGKVQFKQPAHPHEAINALGGSKLPAFANLRIGAEQPPGNYKVKITVTDRATKATASLTRSYQVLPRAFGLARLSTSFDPEGNIPAPFVGEGQSVWVNFAAVGFDRDRKGQPNLAVSLNVLDEDGKPTVAKPASGTVNKDVPPKMRGVPMQFMIDLNRAGKFTVALRASDKITGKTATLTFPLTVLKSK